MKNKRTIIGTTAFWWFFIFLFALFPTYRNERKAIRPYERIRRHALENNKAKGLKIFKETGIDIKYDKSNNHPIFDKLKSLNFKYTDHNLVKEKVLLEGELFFLYQPNMKLKFIKFKNNSIGIYFYDMTEYGKMNIFEAMDNGLYELINNSQNPNNET